jgi:hypothetical protein
MLAQSNWKEDSVGREGVVKRTASEDLSLLVDLERLLEPVTRGDPESPLRWACKSVRKLAEELERQGHSPSYRSVARLLDGLGYSRLDHIYEITP